MMNNFTILLNYTNYTYTNYTYFLIGTDLFYRKKNNYSYIHKKIPVWPDKQTKSDDTALQFRK